MNLDKFRQSCMMPKDIDMFTLSPEKEWFFNIGIAFVNIKSYK